MCISKQTVDKIEDEALQLPSYKSINNVTEDGQTKYCGKASDLLKWIAEGALAVLYNDDEHPEYTFYDELIPSRCKVTDKKPEIVKLTELDLVKPKDQSGKEGKLVWKGNNSSMSPSLRYLENQSCLRVEKSGLYFVSSHLMLKSNMDSMRVNVTLHVIRDEEDEVVMEREEQICHSNGTFERTMVKTSTMGAIFDLKINDCLYIALSHIEYLVNDQTTGQHFAIFQTGV